MLDPTYIYLRYSALKLHFQSESYNCFKYNFKTRANSTTYYKAKGKQFYGAMAKKLKKVEDVDNYIVANITEGKVFVGDMLDSHFNEWKKRNQSLTRVFSLDCNYLAGLEPNFNLWFETINNQHPVIVKKLLQKEISLETVCIIDRMVGFVDKVNITEGLVWPQLRLLIKKYQPFILCDKDKMKQVLLDEINK